MFAEHGISMSSLRRFAILLRVIAAGGDVACGHLFSSYTSSGLVSTKTN